MTPQEIFNTVIMHLYTQGCKSIKSGSKFTCLYRGPNDTKCAVGCLIQDTMYEENMEGNGVGTLISDFIVPSYFSSNIDLLFHLQNVHDDAHTALSKEKPTLFNYDKVYAELLNISELFNLDTNVLVNIRSKQNA